MSKAGVLADLASWLTPDSSGNIVHGHPPAQFDNTGKLATTAFVQRQGMQSAGWLAYNANTILTAAHIGATVVGYGTVAFSFTLPLASSVPIGSRIEFLNTCTVGVNIYRQGTSDQIVNNASFVSVITMQTGDTVTLENAGGNWYMVGGSMSLSASALFGASLGTSGYQKLPSGLIIQWGLLNVSCTAGAQSNTSVTYPIAFPNGALNIWLSNYGCASNANTFISGGAPGASNASLYVMSLNTTQTVTVSYLVVGR